MTYPTLEQVQRATATEIVRWNRFLPTPRSEAELAVINAVFARMIALNEPERVRASKEVGW